MTNGDKFRTKTDAEIVDLIFGADTTATAPPGRNCIGGCEWDSCRECWLAYLGEEAEGNATEDFAPNCSTCEHLQTEIIDDFPVSRCPMLGPVPKPYATVCERHEPKGGGSA